LRTRRVMTARVWRVAISKHSFAFSRHDCPRFETLSLSRQREQGMPGARCTRGLVCKVAQGKAHTRIQVQRKHSDIPCAMALRLMPRSPRRRIRLVTVTAGLMADRSGWIASATGSLAPATGVGTTRFCRTRIASFVLRAVHRSRVLLALRSPSAPTLPRPPHPIPRS
jgi:hypothetical protein